jgi:hypothetical protein
MLAILRINLHACAAIIARRASRRPNVYPWERMPEPIIVEKVVHGQRVKVKVYPTVEDSQGRKLPKKPAKSDASR